MPKFFSRLSYSFGNEDSRTEHQALRIQPNDRVLCITASGDRPLHLLLADCKEVVAVDANKIQNHLLALKSVALQELDYNQYIAFLGAVPHCSLERSGWLKQLAESMDEETKAFWLKNEKMIAKGVIYQGVVEKFVKVVARCFRLLRKKKLDQLFKFDDLEEQRKFVSQQWDSRVLRKTIDLALRPWLTKLFINDPGLLNMGPSISAGNYIYERWNSSLHRILAKESLLNSLILMGKVAPEAFPPYLTKEGSQQIKKRLKNLSIKTKDIVDYLESAEDNSFDCFSLSDVISYLKSEDVKRLMKHVYRTARPGARFCFRQFLSAHKLPAEVEPFFKRDSHLEERLEKEDNCFVYRFTVGTIDK